MGCGSSSTVSAPGELPENVMRESAPVPEADLSQGRAPVSATSTTDTATAPAAVPTVSSVDGAGASGHTGQVMQNPAGPAGRDPPEQADANEFSGRRKIENTLKAVRAALQNAEAHLSNNSSDLEKKKGIDHILYAGAALSLLEACGVDQDNALARGRVNDPVAPIGVSMNQLKHRYTELHDRLSQSMQARVDQVLREPSPSKPLWQCVGHSKPRHERSGWQEWLLHPPAIPARDRDCEADRAILHGDASTLSVLKHEFKPSMRFLVSSTFTDTNEERYFSPSSQHKTYFNRNLLLADVVPFLQDVGRKLKCEVQMVEMRWGIREEQSDRHLTSEICMRQIERCSRESLGLSYVYIAAQKYGFRPFPAKVPKDILNSLIDFIDDDIAREYVQSSFKLDENAIARTNRGVQAEPVQGECPIDFAGPPGPFYVLQPCSSIEGFWDKYPRMQKALRDAARKRFCTLSAPAEEKELRDAGCKDIAKRFLISVTEEEMSRGMLFLDIEHARRKTFVVERTFDGLDAGNAGAGDWVDTREERGEDGNIRKELDEDAQTLLREQQLMIPEGVKRFKYDRLKWGPGISCEAHSAYLQQMADDFCEFALDSMIAGLKASAVKPDAVVDEAAHHLRFASVRAGKFCSTESTQRVIAAAQRYISGASSGKALVIFGCSGSGKTYLLSQVIVDHILKNVDGARSRCIAVRFLGTSPGSSSVRSLLVSLCEQLRRCYRQQEPVPNDYKALAAYFRQALLHWPSAALPLELFIDSVDQLDDSNAGRQLEWLPVSGLPQHVRLVVTTLPDHEQFQCLSKLRAGLSLTNQGSSGLREEVVEVTTISEHDKVLRHLLRLQDRTVTAEQLAAVDAAFKVQTEGDGGGTPLWLTIVAQVVSQWASYDGVKFSVQPSVRALIIDLFVRLERSHGAHLVRAVMGFVTLCLHRGVSEAELVHLASLDDDVLADVYEWWVPPMRTCPPLVVSMLLTDLEPYLSRRGDGSGQELVSWYHRQFWEAAEHYLFSDTPSDAGGSSGSASEFVPRAERHCQLADYYSGRWANCPKPYSPWLAERVRRPQFFPEETAGDRMVPAQPLALSGLLTSPEDARLLNTRRINERMHHAIRAGDVVAVQQDLCSVAYIAAKVAAGVESELLREYGDAIEMFATRDTALVANLVEWAAFVGRNLDVLRLRIPMAPFQFALQEAIASAQHQSLLQFATASEDARLDPRLPQDVIRDLRERIGVRRNLRRLLSQVRSRIGGGVAARDDSKGSDAAARRLIHWFDKPERSDPCQLTIREHQGYDVWAVAYSPCGKWVVSGSSDKTAKVSSAVTGEVRCTLWGHTDWVRAVAFSQDGLSIATGSNDRTVRIWSAVTGSQIAKMIGHMGRIGTVSFSPDNRRIASGSDDNAVKIWDAATYQEILTLAGHSGCVNSVSFTKDGLRTVSGAVDGTVKVWDSSSGDEVYTLRGHSGAVNSVAFSTDGTRMISGGRDKLIKIWDAENGKEIRSIGHTGTGSCSCSRNVIGEVEMSDECALSGHSASVSAVSFSPDGTKIASGSVDMTVRIWDALSGKEMSTLIGHSKEVQSVSFAPDGTRVSSSSEDATIKFWDADNDADIHALSGHSKHVGSSAFSWDGTRVISASDDRTMKIWDTVSGKEVCTVTGHQDRVYAVAFSHDGKRMASGSGDKTVKVWDTVTGNNSTYGQVCTMKGHRKTVTSVAFSPDDKCVVSGSFDLTVRIWDAVTGRECDQLEGHEGVVSNVEFNENGLQVISGSEDGTVTHPARTSNEARFWDVARGEQVRQIPRKNFQFRDGPADQHQTGQYALSARNDLLLIHERETGAHQHKDAVRSVACFKAPQPISSVRCHGATAFVGCTGGAVCFLRAPFLATGAQ